MEFRLPDGDWKRSSGKAGASRYVIFDDRHIEGKRVSLQIWDSRGAPSDPSRPAVDPRFASSNPPIPWTRSRMEDREAAGLSAKAVRFRRGGGRDARVIDSTYLKRGDAVVRISVTLPDGRREHIAGLVDRILDGITFFGTETAPVKPVPFRCERPIRGNVLTVIRECGEETAFNYLKALPEAARSNGGLPVTLVVGERLCDPARAFLKRYRPERIRILGGPHPELPEAQVVPAAGKTGKTGRVVIVAARGLEYAVPAAALACRIDAVLVIASPDLPRRLKDLQPAKILVAGPVALPGNHEGESLGDPSAIARRSGGSYIALCNAGPGAGRETAVFAAALAARHEGVVLPINEAPRIHRCALAPVEARPPGLDASPLGRYVRGAFRLDGHEVTAVAPVSGRIRISGATSDRFGRPGLDLDGDGRLDGKDERPRIGSTVRVKGREYAFSVRFRTALGHPAQGEALLIEPDPARIALAVKTFVRGLQRAEHLAIVGTPDRIPFAIREAEAYFESLDIKQEIAGDAPYADLDEDPSLELAVGRIPVADLITGSAVLAGMLAYPRFEGEAFARASLLAPGFADAEGPSSLHWVWPESEALARGIVGDLERAGIRCEAFLRDRVALDGVMASMAKAGWIGHMNHSNRTTWGIRPGVQIRAPDLPVLEGAPLVFDTGCSSAGIDLGTPLEQTLPGRFFALGAVSYLGNTRPAGLGAEPAVKRMIARLTSGDATLGQAFREGRNVMAHLLTQGLVDPKLGGPLFDPGVYPRMWMQFYNLNLYGDPGMKPRLPRSPEEAAVETDLETTARPNRLRLSVRRNAAERIDPLLILGAPGQGAPREALYRNAPGLTFGIVPHFYLDGDSLRPLREPLAVPPGIWVDVPLPPLGRDVRVEQVRGPSWADQGFAIERDPGGCGAPQDVRARVPYEPG